jgi:hypothetical protein
VRAAWVTEVPSSTRRRSVVISAGPVTFGRPMCFGL